MLEPVTNINSSIDNCSTISIYWDSPTTVNDYGVFYNLSIYDNITGSLLHTVEVNGSDYTFVADNLFHHRYTCDIIAGVNKTGRNYIGIPNRATFSYQSGKMY